MNETVVLTIPNIIALLDKVPDNSTYAFLNDDIWEGETPSDLADNHDHYLYDIEK